MLAVVGIISLGAAADPATGLPHTSAWAPWHLVSAFCGILFIGWTYIVAWNNIFAQHAIIQEIVAQVAQVRWERGLDGESTPVTSKNRQLY